MGLLQQARLTMLRHDWEAMAGSDPMWAVATAPERRRRDAHPWTPEEFYAAGGQETERFLAAWGAPLHGDATLLEVGCGLGRMTATLRRHVGRVYAVDFSTTMLDGARAALGSDGIAWVRSTGVAFPDVPDASCDVAFSYICFQHMAPWMIRANLREVARCLRPGGRAWLHVPAGGTAAHLRRRGRLVLRLLQLVGAARDLTDNASGTTPMLMTSVPEPQLMAWAREARMWCRLVRYFDVEHTYAFYDLERT